MAQPQPYIIELSPGQRSAVILNHVGFDSNGPKHFVVPGPKDAGFTKFEVLDPAGVPVHTGTLEYAGATAEWSTAPSVGVGFRIRLTSVAEERSVDSGATRDNKDNNEDNYNDNHARRSLASASTLARRSSRTRWSRTFARAGASPRRTSACASPAGRARTRPSTRLSCRCATRRCMAATSWCACRTRRATSTRPVFDKWSKDVEQREICEYSTQKGLKHSTWQAAYRQGAGLTIAALARASALPNDFIDSTADYTGPEYLAAAERGFKHLEEEGRNTSYLNDGIENIIDHYAALLAASELYAATQKEEYLTAARSRSASLIACQVSNDQFKNFWMSNGKAPSDPDARPFFHASDAEVNNPFGYPRQYTKAVGGVAQSAFFFPHENESGYWWQGENARLGSLSSATAKAIQLLSSEIDADTISQWKNFQVSAIDWVLGKNPYDMCMLQGRGRRNPEYLPQFPNAPGGVCNGITGGFENENDIAFKPDPHGADWAQNWRWGEQWIPHGAYLALATALLV
ncbi:endochitinase [Obelidium mucronatum]|nr:endochitinase [Obelidium mucronatum]